MAWPDPTGPAAVAPAGGVVPIAGSMSLLWRSAQIAEIRGHTMDKELLDGENVFVIHGFLSGEDCDRLIARSEALGYEAATVGDVIVTQMRSNARVIFDDPELAEEL